MSFLRDALESISDETKLGKSNGHLEIFSFYILYKNKFGLVENCLRNAPGVSFNGLKT
jgi:hypothetical protein